MARLHAILLATTLFLGGCSFFDPSPDAAYQSRPVCGGGTVLLCTQGVSMVCRCGPLTSIN